MERKIFLLLLVFTAASVLLHAQDADNGIRKQEVAAIENVLASDSLQGRGNFSDGIAMASDFIEKKFRDIGLQPLPADRQYRQEFSMITAKPVHITVKAGGDTIAAGQVVEVSTLKSLKWTKKDSLRIAKIGPDDSFLQKAGNLLHPRENTLVLVDKKHTALFARLRKYLNEQASFPSPYSTVFILGVSSAADISVQIENSLEEKKLNNVVGILPGKSRKDEYVVFSAHYDHLGMDKPENGDSIYNGANDDASGTTAVITLARYYKALHNNERTLVFATFAAEEIGGFGSQYFSQQLDPDKVVAMFNIEMIGTESKWGKNSAYITGFDKTDFGEILQQNLTGSTFKFYPDPYPKQNLFYRSDNATLARLGVPAHTISTSKMDDEPNYHKASDEIKTLDLDNMTQIIHAIAMSAGSIVSGKDTPSRVNTENLR